MCDFLDGREGLRTSLSEPGSDGHRVVLRKLAMNEPAPGDPGPFGEHPSVHGGLLPRVGRLPSTPAETVGIS